MAQTPSVEIPVQFKITGEPLTVQKEIELRTHSTVQNAIEIQTVHSVRDEGEKRLTCVSLAVQTRPFFDLPETPAELAESVLYVAQTYLDWVNDHD